LAFFYGNRIGGRRRAGQDQVALVDDGPFDGLALGQLEGLGQGRWEVEVELLGVFAADALDFGWITHRYGEGIWSKD
jgi:hypothetical protein